MCATCPSTGCNRLLTPRSSWELGAISFIGEGTLTQIWEWWRPILTTLRPEGDYSATQAQQQRETKKSVTRVGCTRWINIIFCRKWNKPRASFIINRAVLYSSCTLVMFVDLHTDALPTCRHCLHTSLFAFPRQADTCDILLHANRLLLSSSSYSAASLPEAFRGRAKSFASFIPPELYSADHNPLALSLILHLGKWNNKAGTAMRSLRGAKI